MSEVDLPERLERYGGQQVLERIAIVQADTARLPHFDAETKAGDARYRWFVERYGRRCWELDAMNPVELRDRVHTMNGLLACATGGFASRSSRSATSLA